MKALFHDPLATGLAGERGLRMARTQPEGAWVVAIRTGRILTTPTRAMVLTEGVLGDLSVDEAGGLADDLRAQPGCESWVIDYFSPRLLAAYQKHQPHPNVPVRFAPPSWESFFTEHGWRIREIRFPVRSANGSTERSRSRHSTESCVCSRLDRCGTWATRSSNASCSGR